MDGRKEADREGGGRERRRGVMRKGGRQEGRE